MVGPVIPRAPYSALRGERLAGIGHNQGPPLDGGLSWRRYAWKKARRELLPRLPLEIVRRRVRRASELGLEYPVYASILIGTGRDILGFLFTCQSLGDHVARTGFLPPAVAEQLRALERVDPLLAAPAGTDAQALRETLRKRSGIAFASSTMLPPACGHWHAGRDAIRAALRPLSLPGDAVVMVGTKAVERQWADAAHVARFLPAERYFSTA